MSSPPSSKAAEANKGVILDRLQTVLKPGARVLEIASGSGQHALHFAHHLENVEWQSSDRDLNEYRLIDTIRSADLKNLVAPIVLDILHWPNLRPKFDAVFSANCLHVMPEKNLKPYVEGAAKNLTQDGCLLLYGPFKYDGEFTTESNAEFSKFLTETYEDAGIRDFETVDQLAKDNGLTFESDTPMPANNQFLVWRKGAT